MKATKQTKAQWMRVILSAIVMAASSSFPGSAMDLGLSTRFSDAILENLGIGETYNISTMKSLPLVIINSSTIDTDVQVEVHAPKPEELKEGYEAIPDPNWVKVVPDRFKLAPQARNLSDIIITIPNDPKLIGKSYQVMFWAHTLETGFLGVGVRVRIRFSIGTGSPERAKKEMIEKRMMNLNFRLEPVSASAYEIPVGKSVDLKKEKNVVLKLVNTGSTKLKLSIDSSKYQSPQKPPEGYEELPDPKWLEVKPAVMDAKPDTIKPLKLTLRIPDQPEYRGKRYAALLNVNLVGEQIPLSVYSQILITTEK